MMTTGSTRGKWCALQFGHCRIHPPDATTLGVPWSASLAPGLKRDTDGLDDVRLGAGMALPLSDRTQLYGEYRFLRGRIDSGTGRSLLQREPDSSDFRAGFSIRLD